jgi:hypothetical protein
MSSNISKSTLIPGTGNYLGVAVVSALLASIVTPRCFSASTIYLLAAFGSALSLRFASGFAASLTVR